LTTFNVTQTTPKAFFSKPDNFGFDGLDITTSVSYGQNQSSCTVTATVGWLEGGNRKTAQFVKIYTQTNSSPVSGGLLQVSVIPACGGFTAASDIQANCPGVGNMSVSVPGNLGTPVSGTTGPDGTVVLRGVALGNAVTVTVTPPKPSGVGIGP